MRHPYLSQLARHAVLLTDLDFGLHIGERKEYQDCTIEKWGIYCGMEWPCSHERVARIRILLTGADLYCVTVWRPENFESNVVNLFTKQPVIRRVSKDRETIDRIFNDDLNSVLLYLFGYAERPATSPDGKSWNINGEAADESHN